MMRAPLTAIFLVILCVVLKRTDCKIWDNILSTTQWQVDSSGGSCGYSGIDVTTDFRHALYKFATDIYKLISIRNKDHCVYTPFSLWLTLAALAEGCDGLAQQELFKILYLPEDACLRRKFYRLATGRELSSEDVIVYSRRFLAIEDSLPLNPYWNNFVLSYSLITPVSLPIRRNPEAAVNAMRRLIAAQIPNVNLDGNSVILESFDYQGLWTSAFSKTINKRAPFYNDFGQHIGTVDLMTMRKRVNVAYLPHLQLKIMELPVGYNGRYRMIFGICLGGTRKLLESFEDTIVFEVLSKIELSREPIEVAIPRFSMTTEYDIRNVLYDLGVKSLWSDPWATRNISSYAALPSSFIHRATVTLNRAGVEPYKEEYSIPVGGVEVTYGASTGVKSSIGEDFIANRPFMFALFDAELYTCLFATLFSQPPESYI